MTDEQEDQAECSGLRRIRDAAVAHRQRLRQKFESYSLGDRPSSPPAYLLRELLMLDEILEGRSE